MNTDTDLEALLDDPNMLATQREAILKLLAVTLALEALASQGDSIHHSDDSKATSDAHRPEQPRPDPTASLPPGCLPWIHVAAQVLAGEFDGADKSTVQSLAIGLHRIPHPQCRKALALLQTYSRHE